MVALLGFVPHADFEPGTILQHLTIIAQVDIEPAHFGYPKMAYRFCGFHDRVLRRIFPTVWATSNDFDNLVRAHLLLLFEPTDVNGEL